MGLSCTLYDVLQTTDDNTANIYLTLTYSAESDEDITHPCYNIESKKKSDCEECDTMYGDDEDDLLECYDEFGEWNFFHSCYRLSKDLKKDCY